MNKIANVLTLKAMQGMVDEVKSVFPKEAPVGVQVQVMSYRETPVFGLYAPGVAEYNWIYFDSWRELKAFATELVEKRRKNNETK